MNKHVLDILSTIRYATLSTVDEKGQPWAAPVWYVVDELHNIYWWSPADAQHSRNIKREGSVYITIFDSTTPEGEGVGLYILANAGLVSDEQLDTVLELYNATTRMFKLNRDNTTGSAPTRLYYAKPNRIQTNDGVETNGFYQDVRRDA